MTDGRNRHATSTLVLTLLASVSVFAAERVRTDCGTVQGTMSADGRVAIYRGIPYAAPPVGSLRWKDPQPVAKWKGVRKATKFGARCMQVHLYDDMFFRDNGPSEDCLYLNVWTPVTSSTARLPVMVWLHGGGDAGGTSEPRQDGENLAKKGVVVVSCAYRLGVFGFLALPELAKESEHHASGNYGVLDQVAALQWVRENIAVFGGDPGNVTIFGESAGSFFVSGLMASPLAQNLFQRAIGESGAMFTDMYPVLTVAQSEERCQKFADSLGRHTLGELRAMLANDLLRAAAKQPEDWFWRPNIDGYFLPEDVRLIYASGRQSHVPLLAGWNRDEVGFPPATPEQFKEQARKIYGDKTDGFLKVFPADTAEQARQSAHDLGRDEYVAYCTWKWLQMQMTVAPVYSYEFDDAPPQPAPTTPSEKPATPLAAYHSAEIEFVFEALPSKHLPWRPEDEKLSDLMSSYWSNFAKTGNPNGTGLPDWPAYSRGADYPMMHLSFTPHAAPEEQRAQFLFLDAVPAMAQPPTSN
jgi:para-nitrobenzyl esterase